MRRERESGYVLFGIAIGLVILGVSMTAAVPLWQKIVQRDREQELIFRGYQYMQAIELYQRKYPGAYPPNVEVLIEEKFLRREYKDPFAETEKGTFRYIRQLSPELQQGAQEQRDAAGRAAGITDLNRSQGQLTTPGQPTPGQPGSTRQTTGRGFQSTLGRGASDASMGGIVGVASASDEVTFYKVAGKDKYKDWLFVYGAQQQAGRAVPTVQPGAAGRPGQQGAQSPFPGLPPPPGFTSFRFGSGPAGPGGAQPGQPGQILPGQPGSGARPGPNLGQPVGPGQQQPGFGQPGRQAQPGQSGFPGPQQPNQRRQP